MNPLRSTLATAVIASAILCNLRKLILLIIGGCAAIVAHADVTATITDAGGAAVADAVLTLYGPAAKDKPGKNVTPAIMDQHNKQFDPHVLVVQTHTSVRFPNSDDIHHEVYSFSKTKPFELPLYHGTTAAPVIFDNPGEVILGCNIHDNMFGYIYIVDSPWFAKTDAAGALTIGGVPAGKYRARLWYPGLPATAAAIEQELVVPANGAAHIAFNNAQREARAVSPTTTTRSWGDRRRADH
jgi:plastocyanin